MDGEVNYLLGRAFARVLGDLRGKPAGRAADRARARHAPAGAGDGAGGCATGSSTRARTCVDAGMVGTEMLYFLVGSRELDGGAMVTASHNPKAYTGVKLVREGALALSGDAGIGEIRDLVLGRAARRRPGGGERRGVDVYDDFQRHALALDRARRRCEPLKVVVDGGNGMAGPMVGPLLDRLGLDLVETYWVPDGEFPDHEPNPLLPENRQFIIDRVLDEGADLGIAWDGDADRCFFIDDTGEFVDGDFLTALLARPVLAKQPGATILYDVRASRAVPDTVARAGGTAHVNRVGHAFFKQAMREHDGRLRRRGLRPLLLPRLLVRRLGHAAGAVRARAARRSRAGRCRSWSARFRERYFISGEINSEVADQEAKMKEIADAPLRRRDQLARRRLGRLPRLALQRPARRTPSRCCGSTSSRWSRARTWRPSATRSWR